MRTKYSEEFEFVWKKLWTGRKDVVNNVPIKVGKKEAFEVWEGRKKCNDGSRMDDEDRQDAKTALNSYRFKNSSKEFIPDFERWLKRRLWEDFL